MEIEKDKANLNPDEVATRIYGDMTPRARRPALPLQALTDMWERRERSEALCTVVPRRVTVTYRPEGGMPLLRDVDGDVSAPSDTLAPVVEIFREPIEGYDYILHCDPSEGEEEGDAQCIQIGCRQTLEQVACFHGHTDTDVLAYVLAGLGIYYNFGLLSVERDVEGGRILELLRTVCRYPFIYRSRRSGDPTTKRNDMRLGFVTDRISKPASIAATISALRAKLLYVYHYQTYTQMRLLEKKPGEAGYWKIGAPSGLNDDAGVAMCILTLLMMDETLPLHGAAHGGGQEMTTWQRILKQQEAKKTRMVALVNPWDTSDAMAGDTPGSDDDFTAGGWR